MMMILQMPEVIVEEVAPLEQIGEVFTIQQPVDFYQPIGIEEMNKQIEEYQQRLEEELERQRLEEERQKEEARQRAIQEELERQARQIHFNPYDVRELSNVTESQMYDLLSGTGLSDVAWVFTYAEDYYGINALFLLGITALESGWGTSHRAVNHNNLTGYNIVSDSSVYTFSSRADSVLATAKLLHKDYLNRDGRYFNGYSVESVNIKYCANNDWSDKVISISTKMKNDLLD